MTIEYRYVLACDQCKAVHAQIPSHVVDDRMIRVPAYEFTGDYEALETLALLDGWRSVRVGSGYRDRVHTCPECVMTETVVAAAAEDDNVFAEPEELTAAALYDHDEAAE